MEKICGKLERVGDLTGGELYVPTDRSSIAGMVSRKRSANSHATPSVVTTAIIAAAAIALITRRAATR